ncbi:hypothetical protein, partial [Butyribacter intestini]|uniref:hypothetical protein n=1 Tax=Butyribacter intestini TaxID=1703332 RepID=UPI003AB2E3D3
IFSLQDGRMSRSGLRRLMTTKQMEIYTSYLAKYQQVSTLGTIHKNTISLFIRTVCKSDSLLFFTIYYIINLCKHFAHNRVSIETFK